MASRAPRFLLLVAVVLLALQVSLAVPAVANGRVVCSLHMEGYGTKPGVKSVLLSCSGGTITTAAHSALLSAPQHQFAGVTWSDKATCRPGGSTCLISICGDSSATFMSARVLAVNTTALGGHAVCLGGGSNITFEHALFQGNLGRSLAVLSEGAYLHVKGSSFINNSAQGAKATGAALYISNGTALLVSSSFSGNSAGFRGGAIEVDGAGRATIIASKLDYNRGQCVCPMPHGRLSTRMHIANLLLHDKNTTMLSHISSHNHMPACVELPTWKLNLPAATPCACFCPLCSRKKWWSCARMSRCAHIHHRQPAHPQQSIVWSRRSVA